MLIVGITLRIIISNLGILTKLCCISKLEYKLVPTGKPVYERTNDSFLLTFALADLEESRGNLKIPHEAYEKLLNILSAEIDELKKSVEVEIENARGPEIASIEGDMETNGETSKLVEERENRGKLVADRRGKDVLDLQGNYSVVWIMYMRFARRAEVSLTILKEILTMIGYKICPTRFWESSKIASRHLALF